MNLREFLTSQNLTLTAFAATIDASVQAVQRYAQGDRVPTPEVMRRIIAATGGAVTPNDFYDIDPPGGSARSAPGDAAGPVSTAGPVSEGAAP